MGNYVFDKELFQKKFIVGLHLRNRAKCNVSECDSVCPVDTNDGNVYRGYSCEDLLSDTIHFLKGEVVNNKLNEDINQKLGTEMENQITFENNEDREVFNDVIRSFFFEKNTNNEGASVSLLRFHPESNAKDFGKFVVDVFLEEETKNKLLGLFDDNSNPLDDIAGRAYIKLNVLKSLKKDREFTRIFQNELGHLFKQMNNDLCAVLDDKNDAVSNMEFLLTYYLFIYISQVVLRFDNDLNGKNGDDYIAYFKCAKEPVSEDRDCVAQGWKKIERKIGKMFKHLVVLNMLNCHDNKHAYLTYSGLYKEFDNNPDERAEMNDALDYIISQYTVEHRYETDTENGYVDFSSIDKPQYDGSTESFKNKIQYLYNCVSFQLDGKSSRQSVVSYLAGNYNHILKMRFVNNWGSLGNMMIINNEDLIRMIHVCQQNSDFMDQDRGIQINDLFKEFESRRLYFDGKTKQYIINYLVDINLIDSKCDSEEAQYVKRIQ